VEKERQKTCEGRGRKRSRQSSLVLRIIELGFLKAEVLKRDTTASLLTFNNNNVQQPAERGNLLTAKAYSSRYVNDIRAIYSQTALSRTGVWKKNAH